MNNTYGWCSVVFIFFCVGLSEKIPKNTKIDAGQYQKFYNHYTLTEKKLNEEGTHIALSFILLDSGELVIAC